MQCPKCLHTIPQGRTRCLYCGAAVNQNNEASAALQEQAGEKTPDREADQRAGPWSEAEDILLGFSLRPSKKREPMSRVILVLIFLASFVFGGFVVWLLR